MDIEELENNMIDKLSGENAALRKEVASLQTALSRYREAVNDAIELAEEGWGYVGEDNYFYTKYNVKERFEDIRRRAREG